MQSKLTRTAEDKSFFDAFGFFVWRQAFSDQEIQAIDDAFEQVVTGELHAKGLKRDRLDARFAIDPGFCERHAVLRGHTDAIFRLAFSPDNHWLVTAGRDRTARLWDMTSDSPAETGVIAYQLNTTVRSVAISGDSRWLVLGSQSYVDDETAMVHCLQLP